MSGFPVNLLTALAADLHTAGIGTWNSNGTTPYTVDQTAIKLYNMPQSPDRAIVLTDYPISDDPSLSTSVAGVQVRCRWSGSDPRYVSDLAELIFQRWHAQINWAIGTGDAAIDVAQCLRNSGPVSLGQDANNRWSNSQNFYLTVWRPSTNRY